MDLNTFYYFAEIAKDLNISKTSRRLYLSQQTLSYQIMRLEKYYNTKLFHRHPCLSLTLAGEEVLSFANMVCDAESILRNKLSDVEKEAYGKLKIGASSPRSNTYLPDVLAQFYKRYPKVEIEIVDNISKNMEEALLNGYLDLAIGVTLPESSATLSTQLLLDDPLYMCVSNKLLYDYYGDKAEALKRKAAHGANLADFAKLPFYVIQTKSRLGRLISKAFLDANVHPNIYLTTTYTTMALSVCNKNMAACFITQMNLNSWIDKANKNINIFPVYTKGKQVSLSLYLSTYSHSYQPTYVKYFSQLIKEHFNKLLAKPLNRIAPTTQTRKRRKK